MNINEKVEDFYKMEVNDAKKIMKLIENGSISWGKKSEVAKNAINRCYGVFFFAQTFDGYDYQQLAAAYEKTREELEDLGGLL